MSTPAEAVRNQDHAAALVGTMVSCGVRHAVISPGSRNTPLVLAMNALARSGADLTLHSVLDERSAAFLALGIARASSTPVVLNCTSGSAGAHYLPALIEAFHAHVPLIAVTADRPPELQNRGAPQTIDQQALFGVHVSETYTLPPPDGDVEPVRAVAQEAVYTSMQSGPVHINAQYRKPLWHSGAPGTVDLTQPVSSPPKAQAASASDLSELVRRIQASHRGVFVWGPDPDPTLEVAGILALATHLKWPILSDPTAPPRFRTPQADHLISTHDALLRDPTRAAQLAADLVIQLGGTPSSNALRAWVGAAPDVIAIDPHGVWRDPEHSLKTLIHADPEQVAQAAKAQLAERTDTTWADAWAAQDTQAAHALDAACADGWWSGAIVQTILRDLPTGSLLNVASSMPIRDVDSFGRPQTHTLQVVSSRGVNGIDGTIATSLGLARAWADGPVVAMMGDLAFLHDHASLLLAGPPLVLVVIDNGGGGIFEYLPIASHPEAFEQWFLTAQQADIPALCAAHGVSCTTAQSVGTLTEALQEALSTPHTSVIYLQVDRAEDLQRHRDAWQAAAEQ